MWTRKPVSTDEGIMDFIGDDIDQGLKDYIECLEERARDVDGKPSIETMVLSNLCRAVSDNYFFIHGYHPRRVIDVGCAFGYILNKVRGSVKVGIDLSMEHLRRGKDFIRVRANAEDIPIVGNYFDIAICTDIFEHVLNPEKLISECYRILSYGGLLLFASPWKQDLSVYETEEYKRNFKQYKYKHLRSVNEDTISSYFAKFWKISEIEIEVTKRFHKIKPYSIKFLQFMKEV